MKAMILGALSPHLKSVLDSEKIEYDVFDTSDLLLYISESVNGYDRVYYQDKDKDKPERLKVKDYDFIIPRLAGNLELRTVVLEHLNENLGIYSPQTANALRTASNKMLSTLKFSQKGIRTPLTVWAKAPVHIQHIVDDMLGGLPIISKTVYGSQGAGVSILETQQTTNSVLESYYKLDINVKLQRYIDGSFKDIRAIVVGEKVVVAMERTANKNDFRANLSKDGTGKKIDLSEEDQKLCIDAAKAVGLSFAGVDLMKDQSGKSYCIEANGNPGTKIITITGYNFFYDLVQHCKRKGKPESPDSKKSGAEPANPEKRKGPQPIPSATTNSLYQEIDEEVALLRAKIYGTKL